ncbi:DUF4291 family protein [Saccharopolyspora sp. NPDC003752]
MEHPAVADPALRANRFVPLFSFNRMTWIKPSLRLLPPERLFPVPRAIAGIRACGPSGGS